METIRMLSVVMGVAVRSMALDCLQFIQQWSPMALGGQMVSGFTNLPAHIRYCAVELQQLIWTIDAELHVAAAARGMEAWTKPEVLQPITTVVLFCIFFLVVTLACDREPDELDLLPSEGSWRPTLSAGHPSANALLDVQNQKPSTDLFTSVASVQPAGGHEPVPEPVRPPSPPASLALIQGSPASSSPSKSTASELVESRRQVVSSLTDSVPVSSPSSPPRTPQRTVSSISSSSSATPVTTPQRALLTPGSFRSPTRSITKRSPFSFSFSTPSPSRGKADVDSSLLDVTTLLETPSKHSNSNDIGRDSESSSDGSEISALSSEPGQQPHVDVLQASIADPSVLIGWRILVPAQGSGVVLSVKRQKFSTTRFVVEFESGQLATLPLRRSKTKGSVAFSLIAKT